MKNHNFLVESHYILSSYNEPLVKQQNTGQVPLYSLIPSSHSKVHFAKSSHKKKFIIFIIKT